MNNNTITLIFKRQIFHLFFVVAYISERHVRVRLSITCNYANIADAFIIV